MKRIAVTKKKIIIGALVALIILGATGGVLAYVTYRTKQKVEPTVEIVPVEDVHAALDKYAKDGQVDEGMQFINTQIEAKENSDKKQDLLIYKSQFATKVGRTDVALESAKQADSMGVSLPTDLALAKAYEQAGDKEQAVKYYQQVVDGIEDNTFMSRYKHKYVEKIEELSS